MKQINNYITEKLKINKSIKPHMEYKYFPQNGDDLQDLLIKLLRERGVDANLNDIDVSKVTDMDSMFAGLDRKPRNIDISEWDVSNVTNMVNMFGYCNEFNCDLSNWDVRNVTEMWHMFINCKKFKGEGLDKWKPENCTENYSMFDGCKSLIKKPKWYHD